MKNSFISGAAILMVANAASKLLGAVLKIPLTYIMHEEGMAVYNTAFNIYVMFLTFVVSGMPFAVQKLTAHEYAMNNPVRAKAIVRYATIALAVVGALGTVILWFGADFFVIAMREERAVIPIRAIAPAVFFVALGTAVKSGFQGGSDMIPTAVSQVVEALVKLGAGFFFALILINYGTEYAAAGAGAGVTAGEFIATLMLVLWYMISQRKIKVCNVRRREIYNELIEIALPLLFMSITCSAINVCDTSLLRQSLVRSGLTADEARFVYGAYTGYAMTVLNLPSGLLATLGVSIVPVISGAVAVGDNKRIRKMSVASILISAVCGACAVVGLCFFGKWLLQILFHNTYSAPMLKMAAPSVMFICIMQISGAILQSMGCIWRTFISSVSVALIKLVCSIFLASQPSLNIYGAIIGTDLAFFVGMMINLFFLSSVMPAINKNSNSI